MYLLLAGLAAALVWLFSAVALTAGTSFPEASVAITLLMFFFPVYLVPLLIIFTVAGALGRYLSQSILVRTALFYGVVVGLCLLVLGWVYVMAPDAAHRDAGIRAMLDLMLVPTIVASLVYPIGFLLSKRNIPQQS